MPGIGNFGKLEWVWGEFREFGNLNSQGGIVGEGVAGVIFEGIILGFWDFGTFANF